MEQFDDKGSQRRSLPRQERVEKSLARDLFLLARKPLRKLMTICNRRCDLYLTPSTYHLRSYASTLCAIASPILHYEDVWSLYCNMDQASGVRRRYIQCLTCLSMPQLRRTDQLWADLRVFEELGLIGGGKLPVQNTYSHGAFRFLPGAGHESLSAIAASSCDQGVYPILESDLPNVCPEVVQVLSARMKRSLATKPYLIVAYAYITSRLLFDYGETIRRRLLSLLLENYIKPPSKEANICSEEAFSFWSFNSHGNGPSKLDIEEGFERRLIVIDQFLTSHERLEIFTEMICVIDQLLLAADSINMDILAYHAGESVSSLQSTNQGLFSSWWNFRITKSRREKERELLIQRFINHVTVSYKRRRRKDRGSKMSESTRLKIQSWQEGSQLAMGCPSDGSVSSSRYSSRGKWRTKAITEAKPVPKQEPFVNRVTTAAPNNVTGLAEAGNSPTDDVESDKSSCLSQSIYWREIPSVFLKLSSWKKLAGWTSLILALIYGYINRAALSRAAKRLFYSILAWQAWTMFLKQNSVASDQNTC